MGMIGRIKSLLRYRYETHIHTHTRTHRRALAHFSSCPNQPITFGFPSVGADVADDSCPYFSGIAYSSATRSAAVWSTRYWQNAFGKNTITTAGKVLHPDPSIDHREGGCRCRRIRSLGSLHNCKAMRTFRDLH